MERLTIGQRIEYLRKERGLSVAKLASQAHIPASTLHYVENGARDGGRLSVETAMRLARALGVSLDYLCGMYEGLPLKPASGDRREGMPPEAVLCSSCRSTLAPV